MVKGFSDNEVKNARQKTNKYFWINSNRLKYHFSIASHPVFKESRIP